MAAMTILISDPNGVNTDYLFPGNVENWSISGAGASGGVAGKYTSASFTYKTNIDGLYHSVSATGKDFVEGNYGFNYEGYAASMKLQGYNATTATYFDQATVSFDLSGFWVGLGGIAVDLELQSIDAVVTQLQRGTIDIGQGAEFIGARGADTLGGSGLADDMRAGAGNDILLGRGGNDKLDGENGADHMMGGSGDDTYYVDNTKDVVDEAQYGSSGNDTVRSYISFSLVGSKVLGAVENVTLLGSSKIDATGNGLKNEIVGNNAKNAVTGAGGNDTLLGGGGDDTLTGGPGNDELHGGLGNDKLLGALGKDVFVFDVALKASNSDTISQFSHADDTIELDHLIFAGLGDSGKLDADNFHVGAKAHDKSDRIIYDSSNGALYYDDDGTGSHAQVRFAMLAGHPDNINSSDFVLI